MRTRRDRMADPADPRRRQRDRPARDDADGWADDAARTQREPAGRAGGRRGNEARPGDHGHPGAGVPGVAGRYPPDGKSGPGGRSGTPTHGSGEFPPPGAPVVRTPTGWRVGEEEVSDLTSAMVLADLLAADLPAEGPPTPAGPPSPVSRRAGSERRAPDDGPSDLRKLQETVAQLEHALTVRVRVEQAIGVLAERHRLRPRQAFELLRSAARSRGRRVMEVATEVVDSAANPLLRIPEELAKPPMAGRRGRLPRHMLGRD